MHNVARLLTLETTQNLAGLTERFDADYFPFFFWVCIWAGVMHMISAMIGLVSLVWKVTPFTSQIFELFIATTFIYSSLRDLIEPVYFGQDGEREDRAAQYAGLLLGLLTFYLAWTLHFAETWTMFTREVRVFLTAYNTMIATVVATAVSFLPGIDLDSQDGKGELDRVVLNAIPWDWEPSVDRPWLTNPFEGIDVKGILGAFIPGLMFFLLFIIDHNVSSILTQSPKFNLKKPSAYHLDFFVLGVTFIPCAMLGIPPGNGLIPQAPLHCRALCMRKFETDKHGIRREIVTHCEEQRFSGLGQALLMFVALSAFRVISWIPRGVLFGMFFYLGVGALHGNEIWERVLLCFMLPKKRPGIPVVAKVSSWRVTQLFTIIQAGCALLIFAIGQFTEFGYIYPLLLVLLVPFRSYCLSQVFSAADLKHLDPFEETEDDYEEEQQKFFERQGSFNEADIVLSFRGMGGRPPMRRHSVGHANDLVPDDAASQMGSLVNTTLNSDPQVVLMNAAAKHDELMAMSRHSKASINGSTHGSK